MLDSIYTSHGVIYTILIEVGSPPYGFESSIHM